MESELQTPHPEYLALGKLKNELLRNYRDHFKAHVGTKLLNEIKGSINKGPTLENEQFTLQIEELTNQRVTARKPRRPRKRKIKS